MPQFLNNSNSQLRIGNALGLLNLTIGHIPQDSTNASHERRTVHNLRMNTYLALSLHVPIYSSTGPARSEMVAASTPSPMMGMV